MRMSALFAVASVMACSGGGGGHEGGDAAGDAAGPCWPEDTRRGNGTVTLRAAEEPFEVIEDEALVQIVHGPQGGYHISVSASIAGLHPGDALDLYSVDNPRTLFTVFNGSGERISLALCPFRHPYVDDGGEDKALARSYPIVLDNDAALMNFDRRVLVRVEVVDRQGFDAADENIVQAVAPPDALPDGGLVDAGGGDDAGAAHGQH